MSENTGNEIPGEIEAQAREQGWKPEEEWQGDKSKWKPAKEFLEVGEKVHKVKAERFERELKEVKELLKLQHKAMKKSEEAGYRKALEDIAKQQRQAASEADIEKFDELEKDKDRILRQAQEARDYEPVPENADDPEYEGWVEDNPWFLEDVDLEAYARAISVKIQDEYLSKGINIGGRKLYDEVTKRTKKNFPHKFTNPRREEATTVEAGNPSAPSKGKRTVSNLPPEAKKALEKFKRQIPGFTDEDYLKSYVWE